MITKTIKISILICAVFSALAFGQKTIDGNDFDSAEIGAIRSLIDKKFRSTTTEEFVNDPTRRIVVVNEYLPSSERSRYFKTEKVKGATVTFEQVKIQQDAYSRENGGEWKKPTPKNADLKAYARPIQNETKAKASHTQGVMLGKEKVDLYEQEETVTDLENKAPQTKWLQRFWVTPSGKLLKQESTKMNMDGITIFRSTTIYDYDVVINIEIPVLTATKN